MLFKKGYKNDLCRFIKPKTNIIVGISYAINYCFKFINPDVCVEFTEMWIGINSKNVIEQFSIRQAILWPNDVNEQIKCTN